jgi:hypothetical protein
MHVANGFAYPKSGPRTESACLFVDVHENHTNRRAGYETFVTTGYH